MILFIFNNYFLDNSGFSKRSENELEILSKYVELKVLCRRNKNSTKIYKTTSRALDILLYDIASPVMERTDNKVYISGLYEIKRNVDLFIGISRSLISVLNQNKNTKLYTVVSPLTVPLITYSWAKFFNASLEVLEFHDLEPELAKDIKKLSDKSFILRVEYFLEKFLCKRYKKIIVSSESQKERLLSRIDIPQDKIFVFPNFVKEEKVSTDKSKKDHYDLGKNNFTLTYTGNLSYDYTIKGVIELIEQIPTIIKKIPNLKLVIAGDGDGKKYLEKAVLAFDVSKHVLFTGRIQDVQNLLKKSDVAIVPWIKDSMTETILPTKLLEYMLLKKAIIAPDFGEFKRIIQNGKNGLLYKDKRDLVKHLLFLAHNKAKRDQMGEMAYNSYKVLFNQRKLNADYKHFVLHD